MTQSNNEHKQFINNTLSNAKQVISDSKSRRQMLKQLLGAIDANTQIADSLFEHRHVSREVFQQAEKEIMHARQRANALDNASSEQSQRRPIPVMMRGLNI